MPKVYIVGVTEDRTGLVLAKSPRAKKGESVLEVDHVVLDAIAEIRRYRVEGITRPSVSSPALPSRRTTAGEVSTPSALSPREIQARLRRGESIASVARRAGVEDWRIEVYAAPIAAEQARVVSRARELMLGKRGAGPSGRSLGEAVQANIVGKRVSMNVDEFESAWSAYEPESDRWVVRFEYVSRGHRQVAEWIYDQEPETVTAANRLATLLGWRDPKRTGKLPPLPEAPRVASVPAKWRAASTSKKASVRQKTAAKRPSAKRPAAKRPSAKRPAAKRPSAKRPAAKRPSAKRPAAAKSRGKKAPTRKSPSGPAERAAQFRHLRIVDPPPDLQGPDVPRGEPSLDWREELERRRAPDVSAPYRRRPWREELGRGPSADDDTALEPPDWVQGTPRGRATGEPEEAVPVDEPAAPPRPRPARQVSVDASRVAPRRRTLRRRDRPLRAR